MSKEREKLLWKTKLQNNTTPRIIKGLKGLVFWFRSKISLQSIYHVVLRSWACWKVTGSWGCYTHQRISALMSSVLWTRWGLVGGGSTDSPLFSLSACCLPQREQCSPPYPSIISVLAAADQGLNHLNHEPT